MIVAYDPYVGTWGKYTREQIVKMVADAGYEGVNVPLRPDFVDPSKKSELDATAELLARHRLAVPSIGIGKHTITTPGKQREIQDWFVLALEAAKRLGAHIIAFWPSLPKGVTLEDARAALTENLRAMLPAAEKAGCALALEFEKGCTLDNYRDGIAYVNATDKRIQLTADTYHVFNDKADQYTAAVALRGYLADVHLSGSHRGEPGSEGDQVDYRGFLRGLREIGYTGPLTLQYHLKDPASMKRACEFTKRLRDTK